jgi:alkylation response protein AidB-like acyl-CoA dehydrogenase
MILSDEARMVRETALAFFAERSPVSALRKLRDDNDPHGFSRALWHQMAELGWTGFLVSEEHGGSAFGLTGLAQVMEAAGRTLAATPLLATALIGAGLLELAGSEEQKAEYLPNLVAGELLLALALGGGAAPCAVPHRKYCARGWRLLRAGRPQMLRAGRPCRRPADRRRAHLRRAR